MAEVAAERAERAAVTIANPAPLGLSAFALTTFVLSSANAGWFPATGVPVVVGLALFYGGLMQFVAGIQEFRTGNTFGATAFCSYGGFWLALGFDIWQPNLIPGHAALGFFLLGWTIFTGWMFLGTLRTNLALMAVIGLLFLTFLALALGEFGIGGMHVLGGYLGILTALVAWYTALAGILASGKQMFTLPVWPRS